MVKSKLDVVQWGADRLRIGPWRGDPRIAFIAPVAGRPTAVESIQRGLRVLAAKGYATALTSALTVAEQEPFAGVGFTVHERLHLLRHDLAHLPAAVPHRLRRALPFDHRHVLELDGRAFDSFWRFDRDGLDDARRATPSSRFRVADDDGVVGYAITGRAGEVGYLQRLAVDPDRQHAGIGTALVVDGLWWAARRGARSVLVNTQEQNTGALALYEHLGFVREPDGLAVLELDLAGLEA